MKPAIYNEESVQGEDWNFDFVYRTGSPLAPVNNTGWKAQLVIRRSWAGEVLLSVDQDGVDEETSAASIVLGGASGQFQAFLTEAQTLLLPQGIFVWKFRFGAERLQTAIKGTWTSKAP